MSEEHLPSGLADFLFEVGALARTPRSGLQRIGITGQSVAEHVHRVIYVGYVLANLDGTVDVGKVVEMCLLHDITESRISDLNYIHQKYVERHEEEALNDLLGELPFKKRIKEVVVEYEAKETKESLLAKDADQLELLLTLKELLDEGNPKAESWFQFILPRFKTELAKQLASQVLDVHSDHWWFGDKNEDWWVHRKGWLEK
jgi:putative hydrolase of HD superfamily